MRASVFAFIFLSGLLLASCSRSKLPSIKDPETLHKDCILLYQQYPLDNSKTNKILFGAEAELEIPKKYWPASIQILNPFKVTRDNYAIGIWILHNANRNEHWYARGYYVHTNPNLSPHASLIAAVLDLHNSDYNGIDIFEESELHE
jgi:hypothetical protein